MSDNIPVPQYDPEYTPVYKAFAFVVDGEVAWIHKFDTRVEQAIAVMSSSPQVVVVPDEIVGDINYGWKYSDGSFSA